LQSARERLADFAGVVMDLLNARRGAVDKIIGQIRF
jgi:hypothetical protein